MRRTRWYLHVPACVEVVILRVLWCAERQLLHGVPTHAANSSACGSDGLRVCADYRLPPLGFTNNLSAINILGVSAGGDGS